MEDKQIVALYWKREERAITASEEKYGPVCRSVSYNILQSRPDAEECVNDTWHRAWNTMPPQRPNSLRAYLCRIVRNLSIDRWRQRYSAKRGGGMEALVLELEECVPAVPSAEEQWEAQEVARAVERWLQALDEEERDLFLRRYWCGEAVKELATGLGCSSNGLAQRLRRLRQSLRQALEKEGVVL